MRRLSLVSSRRTGQRVARCCAGASAITAPHESLVVGQLYTRHRLSSSEENGDHPLFAPAQRQPAVAARLARIVDEYSGWHFVNANPEQALEPPAAQRLPELRMPVLAIVGEYDIPDFLQITELVRQQAPAARKTVVPGVGHMANMEALEQVNDAVLQFLTKV